ncbi:MAG TPA: 30S ribosomal protein S20 [Candidatus Dojkabacteria bacterium]|nr:30S ribosomal protein S20 [Candidatus Dojkabacteria bacterium]HQG57652.1 30S ribosomal protein S20 [Candidatus Dojkabacteria bacterium]
MANIKSSQKDIRRIEKRTVFNKRIKRRLADARKKLDQAIVAGDNAKAQEMLSNVTKIASKASQKKVIKIGTAARIKSRMAKKVNNLTAKNDKAH